MCPGLSVTDVVDINQSFLGWIQNMYLGSKNDLSMIGLGLVKSVKTHTLRNEISQSS